VGHSFLFLYSAIHVHSLSWQLGDLSDGILCHPALGGEAPSHGPAPRQRCAGPQMRGTLISPLNFQFSPKANLAVSSPAVRDGNEAIDRKEVQRGAAQRTASLRTPLPRSAAES